MAAGTDITPWDNRMTKSQTGPDRIEWPTVFLAIATYGLWMGALIWLPDLGLWLAIPVVATLITLHASLTHEALHGHPFRDQRLNAALAAAPLNLAIPYPRFRDQHLAHHRDADLTDPYDDPESNYLDPEVWRALPAWRRGILTANNTLLGRMAFGPALGQAAFMMGDARLMRAGDRSVRRAWLWHMPAVGAVLAVVSLSPMPVWAYLAACYLGLSILRIRTFAEHRAGPKARERTVIIEDRGVLGFLFLYNNFHVVHHMHPQAPWYALPRMFDQRRARYLACNAQYYFRSYGALFRRFLVTAKDPVAHPLWRRG